MNDVNRIRVSAPLTLIVVVVSMVPATQFAGWEWVVAALTLPVVTWGAWPFHRAALINARHGASTMDTLVSLGVTASMLWSVWVLFRDAASPAGVGGARSGMHSTAQSAAHTVAGVASHVGALPGHDHPQIYFEGAAVITLFLLIGRYIERRTKGVARDALTSLLHMTAPEATVISLDDEGRRVERVVPTADLKPGDLVRVRPGEKLPADGVVHEGSSAVDASVLTGESVPVDVTVGSSVTGGSVNTWGALVVQVSAVGDEATLGRIARMVADAQAGKADVQRLADRISAVFVPAVIVVSVATFVGWLVWGGDLQQAMTAAVAVVVVACPCALGLATPTALMVGSAQAARRGVILRSVHALEATRRLTTIVLDKTGTLTDAKMAVIASHVETSQWSDAAQWAAAASVEALSEHPIAQAIVAHATAENRPPQTVDAFTNCAGHGVVAALGRDIVIVGQPAWIASLGVGASAEMAAWQHEYEAAGATVVALARIPGRAQVLTNAVEGAPTKVEAAAGDAVGGDALESMEIHIGGMTCASCVGRVERKLRKMGGLNAQVNLATETAVVSREREWHPQEVIATIEAAGYSADFLGWKPAPHLRSHDSEGPTTLRGSDDLHAQAETMSADGVERLLRQTVTENMTQTTSGHGLPSAPPHVCALFAVKDQMKPDAAEAVSALRRQGLHPVLLTGDNEQAARSVATRAGIDTLFAQVTPGDKRDYVVKLQKQGQIVGMVGDGVNDAAALAQADLGMAMGSGTDVAQDVADIVLTTSRMSAVPDAVDMSAKTLRVIRQNLGWAFGYNAVLIPLAVAGMLNPMLAAGAMSLSSVCVVANSLRLRYLIPAPQSNRL